MSVTDNWSYEDLRAYLDFASDQRQEWQGIPVPIAELPLRLHDRHPLADLYRGIDGDEIRVVVGGPAVDEDEEIINEWFSQKLNATVVVFRTKPSGRRFAVKIPPAPDGSMDRLKLWINTIGASDAWDLDAEVKAMEKLGGLLSARQRRHYFLTGSFFETSERSRLTYVFRRLRPTIALSPRWHRPDIDEMRCLAVLCLHPIGYYHESWGGCMVPSDDVIAHLLAMRADEAYFWRCANQHAAWRPEAGL